MFLKITGEEGTLSKQCASGPLIPIRFCIPHVSYGFTHLYPHNF